MEEKSVRGYVFSDKTSSDLVIAFKGTTFSFLPGGGGTTSPSDRASDNLMFSCCCGATNGAWGLVCSCGRENNVCSERCLKASAKANTTYFHGAKLIYDSVLRGALASLVGLKTGTPAFSFEAPGDRLYAERLGLGLSGVDRQPHIFHFGHNADPIFMGTCNGKLSLCYIGGYAMDSRCHTATECTFDAVGSLGWSQSILHHRSSQSLRLYQRWADDTIDIEVKCSKTQDCVDCSDWKFIDKAL
ncbi:putative lipase atg15 [Massospora cicadina]|nr:putative lipase atg15 [Massospora cicadina]